MAGSFYESKGYEEDGDKYEIAFNFCNPIPAALLNEKYSYCEAAEADRFGYAVDTVKETCAALTGNEKETKIKYEEMEENETKAEKAGIKVTYPLSDKDCEEAGLEGKGYKRGLQLNVICDEAMEAGAVDRIRYLVLAPGTCTEVVEMHSKNGCPVFDMQDFFLFVDRYHIIFGLVFILLGLFVTTFGLKMIRPTVFIVITVFVALVLALIVYSLFFGAGDHSDWLNWFMLSLCVIAGLVAGFVLMKSIKFGVGLLGGATGFALGLFICSLTGVKSVALFWVLVCLCALLFFGLTFFKSDYVIIGITALIGSYIWVRGVALLIPDSYINEFTLAN